MVGQATLKVRPTLSHGLFWNKRIENIHGSLTKKTSKLPWPTIAAPQHHSNKSSQKMLWKAMNWCTERKALQHRKSCLRFVCWQSRRALWIQNWSQISHCHCSLSVSGCLEGFPVRALGHFRNVLMRNTLVAACWPIAKEYFWRGGLLSNVEHTQERISSRKLLIMPNCLIWSVSLNCPCLNG